MLIYYFNNFNSAGEEEINNMLSLMPPQQHEVIEGLKSLSRKREQALSYAMLAYAINNRDEIDSNNITIKNYDISLAAGSFTNPPLFRFGEHGKPYITNYDGIFFNISHCRQAIVTAISNHEIGIDVEGRRRFSDSLLERAINNDEKASILANDDPEREFARIWTRKESFFKWTGTGILIDHLKLTENEALEAKCSIDTIEIAPLGGEPFFLSIAQKNEKK